MPTGKSAVSRYIKRHDWRSVPGLVRKRSGSTGGGGLEYHISQLPEELLAFAVAEAHKVIEREDRHTHKALEERRQRQLDTTSLTARQRAVMNARAALLDVIEQQQIVTSQTRRQAIIGFVGAVDENHELAETVSTANDRAKRTCKVSVRSIYNWFKLRDENGVAALAPQLTRKADSLPIWFNDFLQFYARPQKPAAAHALRMYTKSLADRSKAPNYDQVQRALKKLDKSFEHGGTIARHRGREGSQTLKARKAYVIRSTRGLLPTSVYTADGQTFDAEIAHPIHGQAFRPEITSILDVATRRCVGWSVGLAENTMVIVDALRMACQGHGIPAIFYVDRGSGYKNDAFDNELTGFCARLGTTKLHALPQNSQAKGLIERYNGTMLVPLAKEFPTYIGHDMDRQAGQKIHRITRKELKEFGTSRSLPSWQGFLEAMAEAVADYNNRPHAGIDGQTPDEAWQAQVHDGFQPVSVTKAESDDLFRPYIKRRTRRAMVEWLKNKYFHLDLEAHHGTDVLVGYDIHDASRVWIREIDQTKNGERPGKLICVADFAGNEQRYVPYSYERDAIEKRHKSRKRRLETHMAEVDAELSPSAQIEATAQPVFEMPAKPELVVVDGETIKTPAKPASALPRQNSDGIPVFPDDLSLAKWALENPQKLQSHHRAVLRDCLSMSDARENFELQGIDLAALGRVIRSTP
jgi:putative transposase